ncbi:protein phosphatase 1 regulatory subunit 15B [Brienomyrus brachyistius]|uniref:protein phosphatase 1 regulatory subunit 15B n=1 Tax=Brienomyrus brachyistius TaxID=42636 RepID=UPI0020B45CF9|nr:protein phosphatase 1 regulatory subunit 15B [Brienomyrus brachyistius]
METIVGPGKERADGAAVQRSGDAAMLILPWTKQILCVVWDHLRFLVHVIYYSFLAVFQMFRLEVHLRITDETGRHVQHMSTSDGPAESFILSSLFDGTNMLSKCGVDTYAGGSHAALLSGLRPEDLCCSLVDDFVLRATECFSESDEDMCLGHHPSWHPNNNADWDIHVAEDLNGTADMCCNYNTPVEVFDAAPESECTKDLEETSWDDDYDDEDDDESNLQQNEAMWESFTKCNDPYNPLSFSACMSTFSKKEYTHETAERRNGKNPNSTQKEETLQKTYQDTGHVCSDSESGWDSSCESAAEEDEDSQKIWDSFTHPEDPYNPLHFTACTSSSQRACSGGVSHGEETPSVAAHDDDDDDDELDGLGQDDHMGGSESDEAHFSEEDELWNSFSPGDDPYHPLHFRACLRSSPPAHGMARLGPQLTDTTTQPEGLQKACMTKPRLPNRHFKHCCSQRSWDSPKTVPWTKRRLTSGFSAEPQKKDKPQIKKVRFSPVIHVHVMRAWSSALQASRKGQWEEMARDRDRFQRRIAEAEQAIGYCLSASHREKILARIQDT